MSRPENWAPLPPAGRPLGRGFQRATFTLEPGESRLFDPREWDKALVLLSAGSIELVGRSSTSRRFEAGTTLWLSGLPLRSIYNPGTVQAVLVAISRQSIRKSSSPTDEFTRPTASYELKPSTQLEGKGHDNDSDRSIQLRGQRSGLFRYQDRGNP